MLQKCSKYLCLLACLCLIVACGSSSKKPVIVIDKTVALPSIILTQEQKASYNKGLELMEAKNFSEAEPIFNSLISDQPKLTGAYVNLGAIKKSSNNVDEAEDYFAKALELNPNFMDALLQQALILQDKGEFSKAEDLLRRAEAIDPSNALVNYNLGVLYELYLQDYPLAIQYYKRYVALSGAEDVATVERWILLLERK